MSKIIHRCYSCPNVVVGDEHYCRECAPHAGDMWKRCAFVYCLIDPRDGLIRYVGATVNPNKRLIAHIVGRNKRSVHNEGYKAWMRDLIANRLRPRLEILERVNYVDGQARPEHRVYARERWWIKHKDWEGHPLLNITGRGKGTHGAGWFRKTRRQTEPTWFQRIKGLFGKAADAVQAKTSEEREV